MFLFHSRDLAEFSLSEAEEQLLHQQIISQPGPGTILPDFSMLLDFIGDQGIQVSRSQNFLSMKSLAELNARLTHPLPIALQRPQQKTYPHLHGLYLLLRASTLSYVEPKGAKFFLYLDPQVLESWQKLNPTERYFNLLEAWWIWGTEEILAERTGRGGLDKLLMFWHELPDTKSKRPTEHEQRWYKTSPGLYQIALLQMFGLLEVQTGKSPQGQGWQLAQLKKTPWGKALFKLIVPTLYQSLPREGEEQLEAEEAPFGHWQEQLQPFFPELTNYLCVPEGEASQGVYIFKVSLGKMWRRLGIPSDYSLYDLSRLILKAVDFDEDHLHRFSYKSRYGWTVRVNHPYSEEPPTTDEFLVEDLSLSLKPGQSLTYLFDFGDRWEFDVRWERIEPEGSEIKEPTIIESYGEAPEQYPDWDEE